MTDEAFVAWGWRVGFLLRRHDRVGLFIRLRMEETPDFPKAKDDGRIRKFPIVEVFRKQWKQVLLAVGIKMSQNAIFYIITVFALTYVTTVLELPRSVALIGVLAASVVSMFTILFFGRLSDEYGRRRVYLIGAVLSALFAFPFFLLMDTIEPVPIVHQCGRAGLRARSVLRPAGRVLRRAVRASVPIQRCLVRVRRRCRPRRRLRPAHRHGAADVHRRLLAGVGIHAGGAAWSASSPSYCSPRREPPDRCRLSRLSWWPGSAGRRRRRRRQRGPTSRRSPEAGTSAAVSFRSGESQISYFTGSLASSSSSSRMPFSNQVVVAGTISSGIRSGTRSSRTQSKRVLSAKPLHSIGRR